MMKRIIFIILLLVVSRVFSQNKVFFSAANVSPFYLYVDGTRINNRALKSINVDKLISGKHHIKIVFEFNNFEIEKEIDIPEHGLWYDFLIGEDTIWLYGAYSYEFVKSFQSLYGDKLPSQQFYLSENNNELKKKCNRPVSNLDFKSFIVTLKEKPFDDIKETVSKQYIKNNCVSSSQLLLILKYFDSEKNKLKMAKFAYQYVFDPENFYIVNDAFEFSSSINELSKFIKNNSNKKS